MRYLLLLLVLEGCCSCPKVMSPSPPPAVITCKKLEEVPAGDGTVPDKLLFTREGQR
jgi:hypothetical protein